MSRILGFAIFILIFPATTFAQSSMSCLPSYMAAQTFVHVESGASPTFTVPLTDMNANGLFTSKVRMDAQFLPAGIQLSFHFDDAFQGVSLPYNVYAVLILQDGKIVQWIDLTGTCRGPGIGFFPGQTAKLPFVKLNAPAGDFQIMAWGRI